MELATFYPVLLVNMYIYVAGPQSKIIHSFHTNSPWETDNLKPGVNQAQVTFRV